jgi:hypothetical protein
MVKAKNKTAIAIVAGSTQSPSRSKREYSTRKILKQNQRSPFMKVYPAKGS